MPVLLNSNASLCHDKTKKQTKTNENKMKIKGKGDGNREEANEQSLKGDAVVFIILLRCI